MFNKKLIYLSITGLASILLSFFLWTSWYETLTSPTVSWVLFSVVVTVLWLTVVSLFCLFNRNLIFGILFCFLNCLPILGLGVTSYTLLSALINFAATAWLNFSVVRNQEKLIKYSLSSLLFPLHLVLTFFALSLTILYFPYGTQRSQNFKLQIPDELFRSILQSVQPADQLDQNFINQQFDEQIPRLKKELSQQGIADPAEVQKQLSLARSRYLTEVQQSLESQTNLDPENLRESVEEQLNRLILNYASIFPLILSISLYLTLTFFASFTYLIIIFLVELIVWILKQFGVFSLAKETVERERLSL